MEEESDSDLSLTLDAEYVNTGVATVTLRSGSQSSIATSEGSFLVVVSDNNDNTLPGLLRRIYKQSRINHIFTVYHRLLVQFLAIPGTRECSSLRHRQRRQRRQRWQRSCHRLVVQMVRHRQHLQSIGPTCSSHGLLGQSSS